MNNSLLSSLHKDNNGIYSYSFVNKKQASEIQFRTEVGKKEYDYLNSISKNHSIGVMDREVTLFLKKMPKNSIILDLGGCWGWHWRNITETRPDIKVFIIDFIYQNLCHAKKLLGKMINKHVFLIHGDATQLIFPDEQFNGVWTVQTFQHIPDFEKPVKEAYRVLVQGGYFINYSWANAFIIRVIYALFNKTYHVSGYITNKFWLTRASNEQKEIIQTIFNNNVVDRYSEILYTSELGLYSPGKLKSFLGLIDRYLSNDFGLFSSIAGQRSFQVQKLKF